MNTTELERVMAWIKTTDLVEVAFKEGRNGFTFAGPRQPAEAACYFPGPRLVPVTATGVGIFQWNEPGKPRPVADGGAVKAGDLLGLVDSGLKKTVPVAAPCAGRLKQSCVEAGQPVQYGQPLFFLEPR